MGASADIRLGAFYGVAGARPAAYEAIVHLWLRLPLQALLVLRAWRVAAKPR
jgi:hypothetical protein